MFIIKVGSEFNFEVSFDKPDLDVGAEVFDITAGIPILLGSVIEMTNLPGTNSYFGHFTPEAGKQYSIVKSVFTDNNFVAKNTDYLSGSETVQCLSQEDFETIGSPAGDSMREFIDSIFSFIGSESLTDGEFDLINLTSADYNKATFDELRMILEMRDSVSDQVSKLRGLFIAKGANLAGEDPSKPSTNIFIGGRLQ